MFIRYIIILNLLFAFAYLPIYADDCTDGLTEAKALYNNGNYQKAKELFEYGNYYAWGETHTKTSYSWSTYKWYNGSIYSKAGDYVMKYDKQKNM